MRMRARALAMKVTKEDPLEVERRVSEIIERVSGTNTDTTLIDTALILEYLKGYQRYDIIKKCLIPDDVIILLVHYNNDRLESLPTEIRNILAK